VIEQPPRRESERTHMWYGSIGSGYELTKSTRRRDELRVQLNLTGLEMEVAGIMTIPVGVNRVVCDYGDRKKQNAWQSYAAAVASYPKNVIYTISVAVAGRLAFECLFRNESPQAR
jgi:hypothetical protein